MSEEQFEILNDGHGVSNGARVLRSKKGFRPPSSSVPNYLCEELFSRHAFYLHDNVFHFCTSFSCCVISCVVSPGFVLCKSEISSLLIRAGAKILSEVPTGADLVDSGSGRNRKRLPVILCRDDLDRDEANAIHMQYGMYMQYEYEYDDRDKPYLCTMGTVLSR